MRRRPPVLMLIALFAIAAACADAPAADARTDPAAAEAAPAADGTQAAAARELTPIALRVPDMSCRLCARPIEHHLGEMGVRDVKADLDTKWVSGRFDPERLTPEAIRAKVEGLRFQVTEVRVG
ncbi:MAG TPA: heavy metal-associated domain-containing protein [Longimicrobiales bacterium]|nr:heavy metal-associated domain-containing protein [Longimicrobiales bacterium]